jgi:6-phosphogluconate dehydrogenase
MAQHDIGLIGLAVMGQNLVLNMERKGASVAVFNRTVSKVDDFLAGPARGKRIAGAHHLEEFVAMLRRPRAIMLMVKAGQAVDVFIDALIPLLEPDDIIIDGGNSFFMDTRRRCAQVEAQDLLYIGTGVSGGEEGALKGPSLMPGGHRAAYERVEPIFTAIAAKVNGSPCCAYLGPDGAGHYVKMVHNGIEYGDMQLIAEAYSIMKYALGMTSAELHDVFAEWNAGDLDSYLIQITRDIFARKDEETGEPLVEKILDKAEQKGTGKWTSQSALDLGVPTPTITEAVFARCMSAIKDERVAASALVAAPTSSFRGDRAAFVAAIRDALYASKVCSYAQGMALLRAAGLEYGWSLEFGTIASLWRGGCIIRARFLDRIKEAFERDPGLPNLLLDPYFLAVVTKAQANWRAVVKAAKDFGIPTPAFSASLDYFDGYRRDRLPANLIQAQRDYFGAHTYQRIDKPGVFHTEWARERGTQQVGGE